MTHEEHKITIFERLLIFAAIFVLGYVTGGIISEIDHARNNKMQTEKCMIINEKMEDF